MKILQMAADALPNKLEGEHFKKALRFLHEEEMDLFQQVQDPRTRRLAASKYDQYCRIVRQFEETALTAYAVQAANYCYCSPGRS